MPNWCQNDLRISGNINEIERFLAHSTNENGKLLDVEKFIPYPQRFKELDEEGRRQQNLGNYSFKDGFNSGGYEWCVANWGTKWGIGEVFVVKRFKRSVLLSFNTAWTPPLPVIKKMSADFPKLSFVLRYYEGGNGFRGILKCDGGLTAQDDSFEYRGNRGG